MNSHTLESIQAHWQSVWSAFKQQQLKQENPFAQPIHDALQEGKCIRPMLTYCLAADCHQPLASVDQIALAIECLHRYSLIHDDLPCMDNDLLRRGKPTLHVLHDESTALMTGNVLFGQAIQQLLLTQLSTDIQCQMVQLLLDHSLSEGMMQGQYWDLHPTSDIQTEKINALKTSCLFRLALQLTRLTARSCPLTSTQLDYFGYHLGLAFQYQDDQLDQDAELAATNEQLDLTYQSAKQLPMCTRFIDLVFGAKHSLE
jgi:farnesyl diphosphate synthase